MKPCITIDEFADSNALWSEMFTIAMKYPDDTAPDACEEFTKTVLMFESMLRHNYRDFATNARKTDTPEEEKAIWEDAIKFCDSIIGAMNSVKYKFPHCGTNELHDLALDYRIACAKRCENSLKELKCLKTEFPKNLFPEQS